MHHPTDRIAHTTAFVTSVVEHWLEREIAQWEEKEELVSIRTNINKSYTNLKTDNEQRSEEKLN